MLFMKSLLTISLYSVFLIIFNFLSTKYNFLLDKKVSPHKFFTSKDVVPLTGGLLLIISIFFYYNNILFLIFSILIFTLGILADLNIIKNSLTKFIIQFIVVFFFLHFLDLNILNTKVFFIDYFITNKIFSILFTTFCLLILINGTNFIDGVNTLVCGYYILVITVILYIAVNNQLHFNFDNYYYLLLCLTVIYIFNLFSKNYLGDSGSFLLAFIIGSNLIVLYNNNIILTKYISPIFVVLLLWYPAFENLFSIIRRLIYKTHLTRPDNFHFHQLLFILIKLKFKKRIKDKYINSLTGNLINLYNLIIFIIASQIYSHTQYLSYLVIFNILVYLFFYCLIKKINLNK
jgi:UDP-N-acetylmuramyl pentapeptide phosphotransferase/UDP-N-acetylglucosamine-1-phosphate transferase